MNKKTILLLIAGAASLLAVSGCATYKKPPEAVQKSTYTKLEAKEQSKLPSSLSFLSLEDAQNIALSNNPDFKTKYYAVAAARSRYYQSFSAYYPTVGASFGLSQSFLRDDAQRNDGYRVQKENYTPGVGGQWLVFDSLAREMTMLAYRHKWKMSEAQEDDARRILLRSVAITYNNVLLAAAQQRIALADMKYNEDLLKDTQLKFEAGAVPLSDVLNFKIRYNNGESSLISAQYDYAQYKYALAALLGLTEGTVPDYIKFPEMPSAEGEILPDVSVYLDAALASRPDLKAYRENLEVAKYSFWSSICAFGPTFTASYSLNYQYQRATNHGLGNAEAVSSYNISGGTTTLTYGGTASWNLFNGGYDYFNARAAQAEMIQADYLLAETWISVITDVRTSYDEYQTNLRQVKLYQKTFELTKQTRDLVEEEYKAGNAELTRLNEAQKDLITAENNLVQSVVRMNQAKAKLEAAVNIR